MNDMVRMVKTEIWKLKRYHMIWAGVFLMLLSVIVIDYMYKKRGDE